MLGSVITLDYLPLIFPGANESVDELTLRSQLILANHLNAKAVDRSSDELSRRKSNFVA
jgi:hypothetical protein